MPFSTQAQIVTEYAPKLNITEEQLDKLLTEFNAYAMDHYEEGFDVIVECWSKRELCEAMLKEKASTLKETIKFTSEYVGYYEEKKQEVTSHIF